MNGVLSLTGDSMKFFNSALEKTVASAGSAEAAYRKMADSFENKMQTIKNVAQVTMIEIGTRLEPVAEKVASSFANLLAGIKIGVDQGAFDPLFAYLDRVAVDLAKWFSGIAAAMPEALSRVDFTVLIDAFNSLREAIGGYFDGLDLTKADDLGSALQTVVDIVAGIIEVSAGMADAFRPIIQTIAEFFTEVARGDEETKETLGKLLAFAQAIETLGLGLAAAIVGINEYKISIKGIFDTIAGGAQVMWNGFEILLKGFARAVADLASMLLNLVDTMSLGLIPGLDGAREKLDQFVSSVDLEQDGADAQRGLFKMMDGLHALATESGATTEKTRELKSALADIPERTAPKIEFDGWIDVRNAVDTVKAKLTDLPQKTGVSVEVLADGSSIEQARGLIKRTFPDGTVQVTNVGVSVDDVSLRGAGEKLEKALPAKKTIEAELKLDEAKIKARAETVQKSMEWSAKVDIAEIEAATKQIEETFGNLDTRIQGTGSVIEKLLAAMTDENIGTSEKWGIQSMLEDEAEARQTAMEQSEELTKQQIELNKLRLSAMERGTAMIEIKADGLKPHLEAFMWEILEAVQIRANESGSDFLLGIG